MKQIWEYKTGGVGLEDVLKDDEDAQEIAENNKQLFYDRIDAHLNEFGAQGWELVSTTSEDGGMGYVFKRLRYTN